jgi:hypothetical protein
LFGREHVNCALLASRMNWNTSRSNWRTWHQKLKKVRAAFSIPPTSDDHFSPILRLIICIDR